jgi:nitrogen fixation/metabolism regulation signal transduction histidine kinase
MLFSLANAITKPVIDLYETIKSIVDKGKGNNEITLTWKWTNEELNALRKTFNDIASTLTIAKSAQDTENPSKAVLNYVKASKFFIKYDNF